MSSKLFIHSEPIFESIETHPSVHAATVVALPNDDLLASFYGGTVEKAVDITIFTSRYLSNKKQWTQPKVTISHPEFPLGNPLLFLAPDRTLWLFYLIMRGDKWNKCTLHAKKSTDLGETWQHGLDFPASLGWTIRNNLIILNNESILFPLCDESKGHSFFMSSNDNCLTWKILGSVISNPKNLQPAVIQRTNGELLTYIRTGGKGGRCWQSTSPDNGRSWTAADPGPFKNPNSALAMIKLKNGHLVAVYNDSDSHRYRTPLVISLSEDEGRTWPIKRTLEDQAGEFTYRTDRIDNWNSIEFSYPAIVQTEDANIHILYTSDSRHTIKHVIVNEVWLNEMKL